MGGNSRTEKSRQSEKIGTNSVPRLMAPKDVVKNESRLRRRNIKSTAKSVKGMHAHRSSIETPRVLRSRSREKPLGAQTTSNAASFRSGKEQKRSKNKGKKILHDEFSKFKKHLRYLLHRISYEQNLIDVYFGEGWKGLSVEKIKPEKELQRAKDEILRRKLKIRDLFRHVDLLCAEGKLPDCLFDAEGEIDNEDIFCAKCRSKDFSGDNDIILCDGSCERGFHQLCLKPPLLKVPPGDEGWLCPGCDCKVDCIDLLNESQGTKLSIEDGWEKVFPEVASAVEAGDNQSPSFGSQSNDSDDNNYNPDGLELDDEKADDIANISASSNEVSQKDELLLRLPSDDSEDDDYDPSALDLDEQNKVESSSSSDFTSDSEDLAAIVKDDSSNVSKIVGNTTPKNDDTSPNFGLALGQDDSTFLPGKRCVERLDYKRLYDETFGKSSSESSDDEEWTNAEGPKEENNSGQVSLLSTYGCYPIMKNVKNKKEKHNLKESDDQSSRRTRRKLSIERSNNLEGFFHDGSSQHKSSCGRGPRAYGETITQGLYKYFEENQYPDRAGKEYIASELGLTVRQVDKWFGNARWRFRHSSSRGKSSNTQKDSQLSTSVTDEELSEDSESISGSANYGGVEESRFETGQSSRQTPTSPEFGREKGMSESDGQTEASDQALGAQTPKPLTGSKNARKRYNSQRTMVMNISDSSGDEDWTDAEASGEKHTLKDSNVQSSRRLTHQKLNIKGSNDSATAFHGGSSILESRKKGRLASKARVSKGSLP